MTRDRGEELECLMYVYVYGACRAMLSCVVLCYIAHPISIIMTD